MSFFSLLLVLPLLLYGCSGLEQSEREKVRRKNLTIDYLPPKIEEGDFSYSFPCQKKRLPYPWERKMIGSVRRITKDFFRCNGHPLHPPIKIVQGNQKISYHIDCEGGETHSLPLREGKEFVYPILIELLNWVQEETGKRVIITSGHRCPVHHLYADPASRGLPSKHMLGALVTFYVEGMEQAPEKIVLLLCTYFQKKSLYHTKKEYLDFTQHPNFSWKNKEVSIKIYREKEGRDFDNQHPYPYLSIEALYDREKEKRILFSWNQATQNYLRS